MGLSFSTMFPSLLLSVAMVTQPVSSDIPKENTTEPIVIVESAENIPTKTSLDVENLAQRQSYHLDRGEACRYIMDTYNILTGKEVKNKIENPFSDVDTNSQQFILQAHALGIANGKDTNLFSPKEGISKEHFSIFLYRLIQTVYPNADLSGGENIVFEEPVAQEALVPLQFAYSRGLIDIHSGGKIGTKDTITLGEAINILNDILKTAPDFPVKYTTFTSKRAFLTFDDGTSENTEKILEILQKYNVKATFFVTGECDETVLKKMYEQGHVVGNHTSSHKYDAIYASADAFWKDFEKEQQYLENVLGESSPFLRFPGGSNNTIGMRNGVMDDITTQAKENGYIYVDWNVDSGDATGNHVPKDTIVNNVLTGTAGKNQVVILMHQTKPKVTTVEALPEIIEGLQAQGYEIRPMTTNSYTPRFIK